MELIVKHFKDLTTQELYEILRVRESVFVVEQNCPYQEIDGNDLLSYHVYFKVNNQIQAYVRVLKQDSDKVIIGRVLTVNRGSGLGRKIMLEGIRVAKEKFDADSIYVGAQVYAKGFYEGVGFQQISDEYVEDGIPHISMRYH